MSLSAGSEIVLRLQTTSCDFIERFSASLSVAFIGTAHVSFRAKQLTDKQLETLSRSRVGLRRAFAYFTPLRAWEKITHGSVAAAFDPFHFFTESP
jgi:hypothetical protein